MQSAAPTIALQGWVKKQPASSTAARTPWADSQIQRRFFRCFGVSVEYFDTATSTTPRGRFDLRSVTSLSASGAPVVGALKVVGERVPGIVRFPRCMPNASLPKLAEGVPSSGIKCLEP